MSTAARYGSEGDREAIEWHARVGGGEGGDEGIGEGLGDEGGLGGTAGGGEGKALTLEGTDVRYPDATLAPLVDGEDGVGGWTLIDRSARIEGGGAEEEGEGLGTGRVAVGAEGSEQGVEGGGDGAGEIPAANEGTGAVTDQVVVAGEGTEEVTAAGGVGDDRVGEGGRAAVVDAAA